MVYVGYCPDLLKHKITVWGFPKIRGTILGVPRIHIEVPLFLETTIYRAPSTEYARAKAVERYSA